MGRRYESDCVDCGLPCLGSGCRYYRVAIDYCDECGAECAEYRIDGDDLCEDCAKNYLQDVFDDLTLSEKAEAVQITLSTIDD